MVMHGQTCAAADRPEMKADACASMRGMIEWVGEVAAGERVHGRAQCEATDRLFANGASPCQDMHGILLKKYGFQHGYCHAHLAVSVSDVFLMLGRAAIAGSGDRLLPPMPPN